MTIGCIARLSNKLSETLGHESSAKGFVLLSHFTTKLIFLALLIAALGGSLCAQTPNGGYSSPAFGSSTSSSNSATFGQNFIFANASKYGLFWDTQQIATATITNGSGTVTSSVAAFTAADVGKKAFGFTTCSTGPITAASTFIILGTIDTFTSSTQVHVNANANATQNTTACFFWGHPDDAAIVLVEADALIAPTCPRIQLPVGMGMFENGGHFTVQPTSCGNSSAGLGQPGGGWGEKIAGWGKGSTTIAVSPSLATNAATCNGNGSGTSDVCYGGPMGQVFEGFTFDGGANMASGFGTAKKLLFFGSYSRAVDWAWLDFGGNDANLSVIVSPIGGVDWSYVTYTGYPVTTVQSTGTFAIDHSAIQESCRATPVFNISNGATVNSHQDWWGAGTCFGVTNFVNVSGILNADEDLWFYESSNTNQVAELAVQATGIANISKSFFNGGSNNGLPINLATSGAILRLSNTKITPGTTQAIAIFGVAGTTLSLGDGNTITAGTINGVGTIIADGHSVRGVCTGVGTAASTLALRVSGTSTTGTGIPTTCTSTTLDAGVPMTQARTLRNMSVTATAAGTNASSGVVTVLKNGAGTALTCTIGTGTTCVDITHSVAFVAGDLLSYQFTTQAADTLAGVQAQVIWQ